MKPSTHLHTLTNTAGNLPFAATIAMNLVMSCQSAHMEGFQNPVRFVVDLVTEQWDVRENENWPDSQENTG